MGAPSIQKAPSGVPIGASIEWNGSTLPPKFLWEDGEEYSRTEYSRLFEAIGTEHGAGDGSTTFNVPDSRGRGAVGKDDMGGMAANRLTGAGGINGSTLGAVGGSETHQLTQAQLPAFQVTIGGDNPGGINGANTSGRNGNVKAPTIGSNQAHPNVQPSIVKNKIIRYR